MTFYLISWEVSNHKLECMVRLVTCGLLTMNHIVQLEAQAQAEHLRTHSYILAFGGFFMPPSITVEPHIE